MVEELTERERTILRYIIYNFIQTAKPVGSRYLAKRYSLGLSPATIRNTMADLEYFGYIDHPHTSAGRIPTDKGYRVYVDSLMEVEQLTEEEKQEITHTLKTSADTEEMLRESSRLLGKISNQLSIVSAPHLSSGVFEKLELITISSAKIMAVISIKFGLVKTIMMEVHSEIPREKLETISRILNERLSGLTLQQIRDTFADRVKDMTHEETGLIRLFINLKNKLFDGVRERDKIHIGGAQNILHQPEFIDLENFHTIIELLDNEGVIIHILEKHESKEGNIAITIGKEHGDEKLKNYSLVISPYNIGETMGTVAVIGPKRMNYSKVIPVVDYMAKTISFVLS